MNIVYNTDCLPAMKKAQVTEYHIEARRTPSDAWSAWSAVEDPNVAEVILARVRAAGFEGQIVKKTYEREEPIYDIHRN